MPDPLDAPGDGRSVLADSEAESLRLSPDAARHSPDGPQDDPTGFSALVETMIQARQLRDAAKVAGFTDREAMEVAIASVTTIMRIGMGG